MLDFSNRTFAQFFAIELDVDIDDPIYARDGESKGKRLRCFLQAVDNAMAVRTLRALWEHRAEILASTGQPDPVAKAEGRLLSLIAKLEGGPESPPVEPLRPEPDRR